MKKYPKILILMMCKNSAHSIRRCLSNFDYLDYPRDRIRIVISYSPKTRDNTLSIIKSFFSRRNFEIEIYEDVYIMDVNQHWISPLHEATKVLIDDEDFIINIDDDIVDFPSDLIKKLVGVNKDIVSPYVWVEDTWNFYDTWCFRKLDGKHFSSSFAFENRFSNEPFEVSSVGCIVCFKKEVYMDASFLSSEFYKKKKKSIDWGTKCPENLVPCIHCGTCNHVSASECKNCGKHPKGFTLKKKFERPSQWLIICDNARKKGYKVFALPSLHIEHSRGSRSQRPELRFLPKYPEVSRDDWKLLWSRKYNPSKSVRLKKKFDWRKIKCPENQRACRHCGTCNHDSASECKKCGKNPRKI